MDGLDPLPRWCIFSTQKQVYCTPRPCINIGPEFSGRLAMARKRTPAFNPQTFLSNVGSGKTSLTPHKKQVLYSQGDAADAVFISRGQGQG
jgi:hypothetical protein